MSILKSRRAHIGAAIAIAGVAVTLSAAPASAVREDCNSGYAGCGWRNAYFSQIVVEKSGIGGYYASSTWNNNISAVYNRASSNRAIWYDYSGSSAQLCVRPGYENSNLAGTNLQDRISYMQITGYAQC